MGVNRRNFLKGVGLGSLAKIISPSEEEKIIKEEKPYDGKCVYDLAIHSLYIAEEYLEALINKEYTGPHQTYASNIDSATRFIHLGTWKELSSINKVQQNYIPLLEKARDSIDINDPVEIKKHNPEVIKNKLNYSKYAMHVKACISLRILNLKRYSKGLNSDMEDCSKIVKKEGNYSFIS